VYAVVRTGGKQARVEPGQVLEIERVGSDVGQDIELEPVMLVDGETVVAGSQLGGARVTARVVGESKGPKIRGFTYKAKSNNRRRWGHRQRYSRVEITDITRGQ
jgi:large subunit ribosomal protein L21